MRGRGKGSGFPATLKRITPARAGKRSSAISGLVLWGDHPRACGEEGTPIKKKDLARGSPPRVRGRDLPPMLVGPGFGITPARAGKSKNWDDVKASSEDHPRACGEESAAKPPKRIRQGSPPRVRGRDRGDVVPGVPGGITPARAGKREQRERQLRQLRDHPRACGEELCVFKERDTKRGSPPRVRGRVFLPRAGLYRCGITPARAGKSSRGWPFWPGCRDHPRACGEEHSGRPPCAHLPGSPPRVRGRVLLLGCRFVTPGITPARAGKSA